jgi:hypothetical protein
MARIAWMPRPNAGSAVPRRRARTLAQAYRHFGDVVARVGVDLDRSALRAEAIGRCWSQGRLLAWLA